MSWLRIGTAEGLVELPGGVTVAGPTRVFGDAVICADGRVLWSRNGGWTELANGPDLLCAVDAPGGLLIGTEGAHLARVGPSGLQRVESFESTPGREDWYTPWGGAPETRSLARTDDNVLLASVHVGGIPRSDDGGRSWHPTIDIAADVHQVHAVVGRDEVVVAAAGVGFCRSDDGGITWRVFAEGLHATYCRAVAVTGDAVFVSASEGPRGRDSAVYRRGLESSGPFERVSDWIDGNVNTYALDALGDHVVYGTRAGVVWQSTDGGTTWEVLVDELAPITSVSLVP
ncbi:MAG: WD40/YVTN/BNR-like repeat-containing protein [Acidimicrobiia bacterium]